MSAGLELGLEDLPEGLGEGAQPTRRSSSDALGESPMSLEELEKAAIVRALESNRGNLSDVARQLGIGRSTLYRKLEQYGLRDRK